MNIQLSAINMIMPEIIMTVLALVIVVVDLFVKRKDVVALLCLITAGVVGYSTVGSLSGVAFSGMYIADGYGMFFKLIFLVSLILTVLISIKYIEVEGISLGEYYTLMLFATLGMMVMASAGDIISLYIGLELMALSIYALAGFLTRNAKSNEAALKYFLLGAFASALLLYGTSLIYGITGTTNLRAIAAYLTIHGVAGVTGNPALTFSLILFIAAFSFKIAAVPFHMWAPDVYEGAPTSVTAFMSVGPKAAGFAAMGRVFLIAFGSLQVNWAAILIPVAILTMAVGNVMALTQTNIKRMLAYSSVAHAGYALMGIIAGGSEGVAGMMNYLMIYAFMNMGAFAVVIMLNTRESKGDEINDYIGLAKSHPFASILMLIFMFSLTGIPPTAGFIGKFYVFMAVVKAGYAWFAAVAVIFSVISAYFYLRIVMYMYMREPVAEVTLAASTPTGIALVLTAIAVLFIGILPAGFINMARAAVFGF